MFKSKLKVLCSNYSTRARNVVLYWFVILYISCLLNKPTVYKCVVFTRINMCGVVGIYNVSEYVFVYLMTYYRCGVLQQYRNAIV